jgi:3-deoxy-manno-octulosonate cytidylyltransferase (CMP-KDO synthetase)
MSECKFLNPSIILHMKIFAFIPARFDSSRFPGKPLALISGKPMIQHTYERALSCPELSAVYVATDDDRIADCVNKFGGKSVITAKTHRSGTDRIGEAALKMGLHDDDLVVNIQGDQPSFHPSVVTDLVEPLIDDRSVPMSTLKYKIRDKKDIQNPNHVKVVTDSAGFAIYFSRCAIPFCRDGRPDGVHYKHLGFYCFRMDFLMRFTSLAEGTLERLEKLEQLRALEHGYKIRVLDTIHDSIEVDIPEDVEAIEKVLETLPCL